MFSEGLSKDLATLYILILKRIHSSQIQVKDQAEILFQVFCQTCSTDLFLILDHSGLLGHVETIKELSDIFVLDRVVDCWIRQLTGRQETNLISDGEMHIDSSHFVHVSLGDSLEEVGYDIFIFPLSASFCEYLVQF